MRSKDKALFITIAVVAAIVSLLVTNKLFNSPAKRNLTAPTVDTITNTLPDVQNDSSYNTFLNSRSLDPALPVSIGNSQNSAPFR